MNKQQKQVLQSQLNNEKVVLHNLQNKYKSALDDINKEIAALKSRTDAGEQYVVYQVQYQEALKKQISGILDTLNGQQFNTISDYLQTSYEDGFVGVMYDLHGQGIPLVFPIDQKQVVKAVQLDTKLSKPLYNSLGENVNNLKHQITDSITRGIASNASYSDMAKQITRHMVGDYSGMKGGALGKAMQIARTESHRITNEATFDAQLKAKDSGADVVKQWDAALDKRTRPHHAQLDGQIREIDKPFEVAGRTALYPGGFGVASEDINCRCAVLQRAKWALDDDELETLKERAKYFGLDKNDSFEEFKNKYLKVIQTDPNEGKVFHMTPNGELVEGEMPGATKYYQNGLTGEVTVLEEGKKYDESVWTLNEDGSFFEGKAKYQAQYKLNLKNEKVLSVNISDDLEGLTDEEKIKKIVDGLPKDIQDEINQTYKMFGGTGSYQWVAEEAIGSYGYDAIYVSSSGNVDDFIKVFDDTLINKTKKSKLETLGESLTKEQKKLSKMDNKTYSGIWKDDVQVSDYSAKKASIQAKRDWYNAQIAAGSPNSAIYQKYLDDLDEFEKLGSEYEKQALKIKKIQDNIKKITPKSTTGISGDAYSQERKDNAYWFTDRNGSTAAADGVLRDKAGEVWRNASSGERNAIYDYTQSYHKINEPLRGIEYGTNKYLGVGNVDLNQIGVSYGGFKPGEVKKQIDQMTDIIDKSSYDFDIWVNRGTAYKGMDKFFGIDPNDFYLSESELSAKLVGTTPTEYGFMSTGVARGKGFGGNIKLNIYCPKGTKMMYAEPFSEFGNGAGKSWDGISKQASFGSESEMILQRGTQFRVTKVEKTNGTWYIDMDVIGQSH